MRSKEPQLATHRFQTDDEREAIQTPETSKIYQRKPITLPSSLCKPSLRAYFNWDDKGNDDYAKRPALLDLFSGGGGAGMGYYLAGFRIVGVDINPQKNYPFGFHQADALTYPLEGFDVIHASPPCQFYSYGTPDKSKHAGNIPEVRSMLEKSGVPFVIENVPGSPLNASVRICGCQVGLPKIKRVRYFEISIPLALKLMPACNHNSPVITVTGHGTTSGNRKTWGRNIKISEMREAMGIAWTNRNELSQAIPPAYTEFIGKQLIEPIANALFSGAGFLASTGRDCYVSI
uniref:Putative methyltransferase n=2 Tax=viral metagenome TaxID=1070528 RepID=A0A6M3LKF4_9ZZZZ